MDQKEPFKITLSGILRWIFGLYFIVIALGMIIEHEYFSAVFWFLAAFASFTPISNLIESKLNISVSGAVRVLVVIILLAGSFVVYDAHVSSGSSSVFSLGSHSTIADGNVCYWDWKWYPTSHVDDNKAPVGYEYIVATLYLKNIDDQKIATSPSGWNLIADGLKYKHDANTVDSSLGSQDIEIVTGGYIERKIVYLVKGHPTHFQLQYDGTWGTGLSVAKINFYGNQSGL